MYLDKIVTARRLTKMMNSLSRSRESMVTSLIQPSRHLGRSSTRTPIGLLKGRCHVSLPVSAEYQERAEGQKQSMIVHCSRSVPKPLKTMVGLDLTGKEYGLLDT